MSVIARHWLTVYRGRLMHGDDQKLNHRALYVANQENSLVGTRFKSQKLHTLFLFSLIYKFELKFRLFTFRKKLEFLTAAVFV